MPQQKQSKLTGKEILVVIKPTQFNGLLFLIFFFIISNNASFLLYRTGKKEINPGHKEMKNNSQYSKNYKYANRCVTNYSRSLNHCISLSKSI